MKGLDESLYASDLVEVATFRVRPEHPHFNDTGPIRGHLFVFPRTSVRIAHHASEPVVADANTVMFYNRHQEYRRELVSEEGDHCDWFAVRDEIVVEVMSDYEPSVREHPERPFPFAWARCPQEVYLAQRMLTEALRRRGPLDNLQIDETALALLGRTLDRVFQHRGRVSSDRPKSVRAKRAHVELAEAARAQLGRNYTSSSSLSALATELGCSPFHLSRVFRRRAGVPIHRYLTELRLRAALERLADPGVGLTELALELGFNSHSHFTERFRQLFGGPPSEVREALRRRGLEALEARRRLRLEA